MRNAGGAHGIPHADGKLYASLVIVGRFRWTLILRSSLRFLLDLPGHGDFNGSISDKPIDIGTATEFKPLTSRALGIQNIRFGGFIHRTLFQKHAKIQSSECCFGGSR